MHRRCRGDLRPRQLRTLALCWGDPVLPKLALHSQICADDLAPSAREVWESSVQSSDSDEDQMRGKRPQNRPIPAPSGFQIARFDLVPTTAWPSVAWEWQPPVPPMPPARVPGSVEIPDRWKQSLCLPSFHCAVTRRIATAN